MKNDQLFDGNCIRTYTGIYMDVFNPKPEMIDIMDIAHGLSNLCRFGGHTNEFYSVAQHSFLCSQWAPKKFQFEALMHDAAEAYLLDIPRPIKQNLTGYKELEDNLMKMIAEKFDFPFPISKEVKDIDQVALEFEFKFFMLGVSIDEGFDVWTPELAKSFFINQFSLLS